MREKQTTPLLNKHYQNEVTLKGQNSVLKYCHAFDQVLDLSEAVLCLSVGQRAAN